MKLTPHLINSAPSYINPAEDRVLILRGLKADRIENLGVTNDLNETLDLTDNNVTVLGNFPLLSKLKTLLISQNQITYIDANLSQSLPNLKALNLCGNNISDLEMIANSLQSCKKLETLVLKDNPASNYRLYLIHKIPSLKILDFEKVKDKERALARKTFGEDGNAAAIPQQNMSSSLQNLQAANDTQPMNTEDRKIRKMVNNLSEEKRKVLEMRLLNATNLDEIEKIENALKNGEDVEMT